MEYNIELLRESAALNYQFAESGEYSIDPDRIFMECCINAGLTMDEAVDAAIQKIRLYMSEEAKICKNLSKEAHKAIKKKDWATALKLCEKRLAHLQNLEKRADDIDDDELYILQMESLTKSFIFTAILGAVLVKVADGILPGSGPLVSMVKKIIKQFTITDFSKLKGGKILGFIQDMVVPFMNISAIAKIGANKITSKKVKTWRKNRDGDVNREINAGNPDPTTMSVSRTQAKTRYRKMIELQKQEIIILKANMQESKKDSKEEPTNEAYNPTHPREPRDQESESIPSEAMADRYFTKTMGNADKIWIDQAVRKCPIPRGLKGPDLRDAIVYSIDKATKIPEFKTFLQIYNKAIKLHDDRQAGEKFPVRYILKPSDFNIEDCADYVDIGSFDQEVASYIVQYFYKLAKRLVTSAGYWDVHIDMGDGDEGCLYIDESAIILYEAAALISSGCSDKMEILQEAKLKAAARNELPDSAFGIPEDRKYPLNDAAHVKAAIKMFSHCPDAKKAALAKRIVSAMSKFGVDVTFDEKSPMYNYVPKKYQK